MWNIEIICWILWILLLSALDGGGGLGDVHLGMVSQKRCCCDVRLWVDTFNTSPFQSAKSGGPAEFGVAFGKHSLLLVPFSWLECFKHHSLCAMGSWQGCDLIECAEVKLDAKERTWLFFTQTDIWHAQPHIKKAKLRKISKDDVG